MPPIAREPVLSALRTVLDPEVGVNIVDLGLVYGIDMEGDDLRVRMTMTSAACPLGTYLERAVERAVRARVPDLRSVQVALVWDPPWDPAMMSSEARRQLGWRQ